MLPWRPLVLLLLLRPSDAHRLHADTALTSGAWHHVVHRAPAVLHNATKAKQSAKDSCLADDIDKVLKGMKKSHEKLNKCLGLMLVLLMFLSALVLVTGHRYMTFMGFTSVLLSSFVLTFVAMRRFGHHHCAAPVWCSVIVSLLTVGVAVYCLEVALIVPGIVFGEILARQAQAVLLTASPQLASNVFVADYFWIVDVLAAVTFGYLAHKFKIVIMVTSMLGAFGLEFALREIFSEFFNIEMTRVASLICITSFFIVGLICQLCFGATWTLSNKGASLRFRVDNR